MRHQRSAGRFHLPLRGVPFRASLIVCSLLALGLLFFGRAEAYMFDRVREAVENATGPIYEFFGPPVATARNVLANGFRIFSVYGENERLREENARLKTWQSNALALEQKMASYEALLQLPLEPDIAYRTGRVVDDPGGPFVRTLRVNLGSEDGVAEGQAVVGPDGLIGRIVGRAKTDSRILLVTDLNSRIPVRVEPHTPMPAATSASPAQSQAQVEANTISAPAPPEGMLIGENDAAPIVDFLHGTPGEDLVVRRGDRVVTSGKDGLLPPHILVGTVTKVEGDRATIELATNFDRISYVRVLDYASPFGVIPAGKGPPVLNSNESALSAGAETTGATANAANAPSAPLAAKPALAKAPTKASVKTPKPVTIGNPADPAPAGGPDL